MGLDGVGEWGNIVPDAHEFGEVHVGLEGEIGVVGLKGGDVEGGYEGEECDNKGVEHEVIEGVWIVK